MGHVVDMTTLKMSTGQTYSLVYRTEAVLTPEVMTPTTRYGLQRYDDALAHDIDVVG